MNDDINLDLVFKNSIILDIVKVSLPCCYGGRIRVFVLQFVKRPLKIVRLSCFTCL